MKRFLLGLLIVICFSSHDMFLKLEQYFLEPNTDYVIELVNGTYELSDNVITRDRMLDVSIVANGTRTRVDTVQWFEKDKATYLNITTGEPGTYVTGVSTRARSFGQTAEAFNNYLEHDGVLDMLELRKQNGTLGDSAIERYSKHVKTLFQVGEKLTDDYKTELGYPIEFVLLENPYEIHTGHNLPVKLLFNQKPLPNQLVYVGSEVMGHTHTHDGETHTHGGESHTHDADSDHKHDDLLQLRTDEQGIVNVPISSKGIWRMKTIHLVEAEEEGLTHESNWATVTFAIGDGHGHSHDHDHPHGHDHSHGSSIPDYIYVIISILLIALLYLLFDRKKK